MAGKKFLNGIDLSNQKAINVASPSADTDAANKAYVDSTARGIDWKASVRAATTAAGTLATDFENGDTIDGVVLATGNRVLIKNQAAGAENGIYVVAASGAPTRATDADISAEVTSGMAVTVTEGTVHGDQVWILTTNDTITLDTTALAFTQLGGAGTPYTGGAGLVLTSYDFAVGAGTGITVNANDVAIDTAVVVRKYAANIGNGSATSIAVTHSLGTRDITVSVHNASTYEEVECDVVKTDANTVTLDFAVAPTSNQYRVVVHG